MHETYQATWHKQGTNAKTCWDDLPPSEKLPPLQYSETDTDGWEDIDVPILYFNGGLLQYSSQYAPSSMFAIIVSPFTRYLLQWPLALPNDGLTDLVVQETTSPASLMGQIRIGPEGGQYWSETVSEQFYSLKQGGTNPGKSLSLCHSILKYTVPHSNTFTKSTHIVSRLPRRAFWSLTVKIPHVPISKSRFIRGWVRF